MESAILVSSVSFSAASVWNFSKVASILDWEAILSSSDCRLTRTASRVGPYWRWISSHWLMRSWVCWMRRGSDSMELVRDENSFVRSSVSMMRELIRSQRGSAEGRISESSEVGLRRFWREGIIPDFWLRAE